MKNLLCNVATVLFITATAVSCYNLAPENTGVLSSADIYSGAGNVLNIDSLVAYVKSYDTKYDGLYYRGGDIADVEYSYNGKHHKRVNIRCDVFDTPAFISNELPDVEMDEDGNMTINGKKVKRILVDGKEVFYNKQRLAGIVNSAIADSIYEAKLKNQLKKNAQDQQLADALANICKSLAGMVDASNSSVWESQDSIYCNIALREYPQGDTLKRWNGRKVVDYSHAPEIVKFYSTSSSKLGGEIGGGNERFGSFSYEFTPDSVENKTHELLNKKEFLRSIKPVLKQMPHHRDIYISHDANCSVKPSFSNMSFCYQNQGVMDGNVFDQSFSETKGRIYTIDSAVAMEELLHQLNEIVWRYLDLHPHVYYTFHPDISVLDDNFAPARLGTLKHYFTIRQETTSYEDIAIFLNSSDTGYNLLVLDTKGDLWLPKEWPIMKSWKNGKVVYREKRNAEDSRNLGGFGWTSISHGYKPWTELEKPQKKDKKKSVQSL